MTTVTTALVARETLSFRNPEVRVNQNIREVLHSVPTGQYQALTCDIAEFYFNPGVFIDFTSPTNRAKFHTAGLKPAPLSGDGSAPTGSAPLVYLSVSVGIDPSIFPNNASGHNPVTLVTVDNHGRGYGTAQAPNPSD